MACTVAVEESITEHYNDQIRELLKLDPELHGEMIQLLKKFRDEEQEHLDIGLEHGAEQGAEFIFLCIKKVFYLLYFEIYKFERNSNKAPQYKALKILIKTGCQAAIAISEKI